MKYALMLIECKFWGVFSGKSSVWLRMYVSVVDYDCGVLLCIICNK